VAIIEGSAPRIVETSAIVLLEARPTSGPVIEKIVGAPAGAPIVGRVRLRAAAEGIAGGGRRRLSGAECPRLGKEGVETLYCIHVDGEAAIPNKGAIHAVEDVVGRAEVGKRDEGKAPRGPIDMASNLAECRIPDAKNVVAKTIRVELVRKIPKEESVHRRAAQLGRVPHRPCGTFRKMLASHCPYFVLLVKRE
jgi:hypothetical protein